MTHISFTVHNSQVLFQLSLSLSHVLVLVQSHFYVVSNVAMLFTANTGHSPLLLFSVICVFMGYSIQFLSHIASICIIIIAIKQFGFAQLLGNHWSEDYLQTHIRDIKMTISIILHTIPGQHKNVVSSSGWPPYFYSLRQLQPFQQRNLLINLVFCCPPFSLHIYSLYVCLWLCVYHLPLILSLQTVWPGLNGIFPIGAVKILNEIGQYK